MKIRAANMRYADIRHALYALIAATLAICCVCPAATAATPKAEIPKRLVIIDQDAFGPAGSNLQAILLLLQASDVEVHRIARGNAPFAAYLDKFGQSYPMWDELAVAAWLDPSIVTRSEQLLVDVDTSFTAGYGDTLSWSMGEGPGLGERPVQVVLDIDLPKFEALTMDLLSRRASGH